MSATPVQRPFDPDDLPLEAQRFEDDPLFGTDTVPTGITAAPSGMPDMATVDAQIREVAARLPARSLGLRGIGSLLRGRDGPRS